GVRATEPPMLRVRDRSQVRRRNHPSMGKAHGREGGAIWQEVEDESHQRFTRRLAPTERIRSGGTRMPRRQTATVRKCQATLASTNGLSGRRFAKRLNQMALCR